LIGLQINNINDSDPETNILIKNQINQIEELNNRLAQAEGISFIIVGRKNGIKRNKTECLSSSSAASDWIGKRIIFVKFGSFRKSPKSNQFAK